MDEALAIAETALNLREVPVGCVFLLDGQVIGRGRNRVNEFCNATMHAELVGFQGILRKSPQLIDENSRFISNNVELYVTCEPCIMCTALLNRIGVKKVVFACKNEKFGGCGSVLTLNAFEIEFKQEFEKTSINLLQQFYSRGNPEAPTPRKEVV